jgi:hypothetical protein
MSKLGESKSKLGVPPIPLHQKEESSEFMRGYKEGYADGKSGKLKKF